MTSNQTAKVSPNYNETMINDIMSSYQATPVRSTVDALQASMVRPHVLLLLNCQLLVYMLNLLL